MNKSLYEKYIEIDALYQKIEADRESIRGQILDALVKNDLERDETAYGIFSVASKKKWTYTDRVKELEEKVKLQKVKEEKHGDATVEIGHYLKFTKNEDNKI